ncbi:MAG: VPS10 domain-containing protein, partial [Flavobacteriaceae bacterium]
IYALVEAKKNALYKSEDGGFKWIKINDKSDIGNRPFYYSEIYVDPQNENRVFSIFTYVNVSEDGGKNFSELMPAYGVDNGVHPDHHAWWIHPEDGSFMMDGNDGGLNITRDGGKTWHFIDNLPVGQFYHISADNEYPYNVYGGMQDNGSWRGPAYVWRAQSIRNSYWQEIAFGDGFDVVPDRDDSRYGYAMSQQGNVLRYDWMTGNNYGVRPTPEDPNTKLRFNWNAAIGQDPFDNSTVYFGSQFVHKSDDKGTTWKIISPDLTTNDPEKQKQSESGGLTMDATGAENHCTILVIEPSEVEPNMLWVGTDDGRVHFTLDGGMNWDDVSKNLKGLPEGSWIAQIKASKNNPGEALLVANNYRRFDYTPYVYRTKNYGKSWSRIVDEDDVQSYALSIIEDSQNPNLIFLGTDDGLYLSLNAGENWQKYTNGFPTVSTKDLAIHQREQDLLIGTFGRALWVMDDIRPLRAIAADPEILNKDFYLFDPPTGYQVAYQQPTGSRFGGDAMYGGENKKSGAMISYFVGKGSEDLKEKDSISFEFYDQDRLMRTIKMPRPKKAGIHRWYWRMDEKGVQRPRRSLRKSKVEPSGVRVLPGTYTIKGALGESSNETAINVAFDPRLTYDEGALRSVYNAQKELESLTARSAEAVGQLLESKQSVSALSKQFQENDKEGFKEAIKQSKEITKEIDKLVAIFLGSIDKRQGITRNPEITVSSRISGAYRYVASRKTEISETETRLMQFAKDDLNQALKKVNSFYEEQWGKYQKEMENVKLKYFKEVKSFDIEN